MNHAGVLAEAGFVLNSKYTIVSNLPLEGANGSTSFPDSRGLVWTGVGSPTISTATRAAGALLLNGTSQALSTPSQASLQMGTAEMVFEASIRITAYATVYFGTYQALIFGKDIAAGREYIIGLSGTATSWTGIAIYGFSSNTVFVVATMPFTFLLNTDYAIKIRRDPYAGTSELTVNGALVSTQPFSVVVQPTSTELRLGGNSDTPNFFPGYIWGVKISRAKPAQLFGDSITFGLGASVPANSYASKLAAAKNWAATNNAVSGDMVFDQAAKAFAKTIVAGDRATLMIGVNDQRVYGIDAPRLALFKRAHLAVLAWLGIAETNKLRGQSGSIAKTGTWTNASIYGGALVSQSIVAGSKATASLSGSVIYLCFLQQAGVTSTCDIRVDGVLVASYNSAGPSMSTVNGLNYGPALVRLAGLSSGAHSVEITVTAAGSGNPLYLAWAGTPKADARMNVLNVIRSTAAEYATHGGSDANVSSYNVEILDNVKTLQGDGINVAHSNVWAVLDPNTETSDGTHPNDTGHAKIAARAAADF